MDGEPTSTNLLDQITRLLPGARDESHRRLAANVRLRTFPPDSIVFAQGEPIPLTLVLRGHAAFRRTTADGRELVLGIARPGMLFGFSSIAGSRATVDLVAVTATEIANWPADDVRSLARDDAGLALDVIDG